MTLEYLKITNSASIPDKILKFNQIPRQVKYYQKGWDRVG